MSRRDRSGRVSLLVRNLPLDTRPEELRDRFAKYGEIRDVYLPRDYYSNRAKGFGFIEFRDTRDADDALAALDRSMFGGREISVVLSKENRKTPREMLRREDSYERGDRGGRDSQRDDRRGSSRRSRSPRRQRSSSRSPPRRTKSPSRGRSRSYSRSRSPAVRARSPVPSPRRSPEPVAKDDERGAYNDKADRSPRERSPRD